MEVVDPAADGVQTPLHADDAEVIGSTRQWCGRGPAIARGIIDVVVGPINTLFRIPTDEVQTPCTFGPIGVFLLQSALRRRGGISPL
jgi:hypothetical protein